jgi:hypothetical protein
MPLKPSPNAYPKTPDWDAARTFSPPIKLHRYALVHILPQIQNILLLRPLPTLRVLRSMAPTTTAASMAAAPSAATSVFGVPSTATAPAASGGLVTAFGHRGCCELVVTRLWEMHEY